MKTIPRNHAKRINAIFTRAHSGRRMALDNNFCGEGCSIEAIRLALDRGQLTDYGDGNYRVHVHSRLWFDFRA